jgi:hypothetical protein
MPPQCMPRRCTPIAVPPTNAVNDSWKFACGVNGVGIALQIVPAFPNDLSVTPAQGSIQRLVSIERVLATVNLE